MKKVFINEGNVLIKKEARDECYPEAASVIYVDFELLAKMANTGSYTYESEIGELTFSYNWSDNNLLMYCFKGLKEAERVKKLLRKMLKKRYVIREVECDSEGYSICFKAYNNKKAAKRAGWNENDLISDEGVSFAA